VFFRAKQWTIALYLLSILDFSNVNMADAYVTATRRSKVLTRSVPTDYTVLKPSAEYNQRLYSTIIEDLRAGCSTTEIIRFFGYPISTVHDVTKYTIF